MKLVRNIKKLVSLQRAFEKKARFISEHDLSILNKHAMLIDKGKIVWLGPNNKIPKEWSKKKIVEINAQGATALPGFIESHTHLIFAGDRANEFEKRMNGTSYQEIAAQGGGILSTVEDTRKASFNKLLKSSQLKVNEFTRQGVTTIEVKSGYGLNLGAEIKMLQVAKKLKGPSIVPTFLGAHAKPKEFRTHEEYLEYLSKAVLPEIKKKGLSERIDIFIEEGFFTTDIAKPFLRNAQLLGFKVCIHADQLSLSGGAELAVELNALSADHLLRIKQKQIWKLARSEVTAVLLPTADLYMRTPYPPARALINAGVKIALSTDFNPGSSPTQDISLVGVLARTELKMSLPEVISAYTVGGAYALGLLDRGALMPSMRADFTLIHADWQDLFYSVGNMPIEKVFAAGKQIY